MKIISHRGNIVGPNASRENKPSYIDTAISAGFDVEVDITFNNGKFYLGHDTPDYEITEKWVSSRKDKLWLHCKNLDAATRLHELGDSHQFFCHSSDSYVLCSNGKTWVHDLKLNISKTTIIPLLSYEDVNNYNGLIPYAICTDFVSFAEYSLNQKGLYK